MFSIATQNPYKHLEALSLTHPINDESSVSLHDVVNRIEDNLWIDEYAHGRNGLGDAMDNALLEFGTMKVAEEDQDIEIA